MAVIHRVAAMVELALAVVVDKDRTVENVQEMVPYRVCRRAVESREALHSHSDFDTMDKTVLESTAVHRKATETQEYNLDRAAHMANILSNKVQQVRSSYTRSCRRIANTVAKDRQPMAAEETDKACQLELLVGYIDYSHCSCIHSSHRQNSLLGQTIQWVHWATLVQMQGFQLFGQVVMDLACCIYGYNMRYLAVAKKLNSSSIFGNNNT